MRWQRIRFVVEWRADAAVERRYRVLHEPGFVTKSRRYEGHVVDRTLEVAIVSDEIELAGQVGDGYLEHGGAVLDAVETAWHVPGRGNAGIERAAPEVQAPAIVGRFCTQIVNGHRIHRWGGWWRRIAAATASSTTVQESDGAGQDR